MKFPCCSLSLVLLLFSAPADPQSAGSATADDLPRHGIVGLVVSAADSSKPEDPEMNPPTVKSVVTGGPGEAAGIQIGDTLLEIDGKPVATAASIAQEIGRHPAGAAVRVVLRRAGQKKRLS